MQEIINILSKEFDRKPKHIENVIEMLVFFTFVDSKYKDSVSINILPYQGIIYPYSPDIEVIAVTTLHL